VIILDPKGLFGGKRVRLCSDSARLRFPYYMLASNGFARLELDGVLIRATCFLGFAKPPSDEVIQTDFFEYESAGLCFIYEAEGARWVQWDCPSRLLPRHKTAEDRRSPQPTENKAFQKSSENLRNFPRVGAVVGAVVVAEEVKKKTPAVSKKKPAPLPTTQYGEFLRCSLTEGQHERLAGQLGDDLDGYIERYDSWVEEAPQAKAGGVRRQDRNPYLSIRRWYSDDQKNGGGTTRATRRPVHRGGDTLENPTDPAQYKTTIYG